MKKPRSLAATRVFVFDLFRLFLEAYPERRESAGQKAYQ